MKARFLIPFFLFGLIIAVFVLGLFKMKDDPNFARNVPSVLIDKKAPNITLPDLFDPASKVASSALQGKVWLLNIWGTWCPECWREHDFLLYLARHEDMPIFGINWRDDATEAKRMLADKGNPFIAVGFDPKSRAVMDWGVYGAPETFLIDMQGFIRWKKAGAITPELWRDELKPLIEKLEKS